MTRHNLRFNPTMVRLLPQLPPLAYHLLHEFQSHNGAIAARPCLAGLFRARRFQSHNGAIAALDDVVSESVAPRFQSHNGAIAAWD